MARRRLRRGTKGPGRGLDGGGTAEGAEEWGCRKERLLGLGADMGGQSCCVSMSPEEVGG